MGITELQIRDTVTKQLLANTTVDFDIYYPIILDLDWSPDDQTVALY